MGQVGDDVPPLEHDPEKACPRDGHQGVYARLRGLWMDTGFRKRSCATNNVERDDDSKISHSALGALPAVPLFQHLRDVGVSKRRRDVAGGLAFLVSEASIGAGLDEGGDDLGVPGARGHH
jgi:hypothetical protein